MQTKQTEYKHKCDEVLLNRGKTPLDISSGETTLNTLKSLKEGAATTKTTKQESYLASQYKNAGELSAYYYFQRAGHESFLYGSAYEEDLENVNVGVGVS